MNAARPATPRGREPRQGRTGERPSSHPRGARSQPTGEPMRASRRTHSSPTPQPADGAVAHTSPVPGPDAHRTRGRPQKVGILVGDRHIQTELRPRPPAGEGRRHGLGHLGDGAARPQRPRPRRRRGTAVVGAAIDRARHAVTVGGIRVADRGVRVCTSVVVTRSGGVLDDIGGDAVVQVVTSSASVAKGLRRARDADTTSRLSAARHERLVALGAWGAHTDPLAVTARRGSPSEGWTG